MTVTTAAPQVQDETSSKKRAAWRPMAAAAAAGSVLLIAGFGVYASLNAEATGVQDVNAGTLRLALDSAGTAGFTQKVTNMGAGDTQTRYVTLTNNGTLEARNLTMAIAASGDGELIANTADTAALRVTVANCDVAWVGGLCGGGAGATVIDNVVLSALATPNAFAGVDAVAASKVFNLKVTVALPEQDELYRDGVLTNSGTKSVQNKNANLAYTFAQTQRVAVSG
jgi:hypothetical protein